MKFTIGSNLNEKSTPKGLNSTKSEIYIFDNASEKSVHSLIVDQIPTWQKSELKSKTRTSFSGNSGPIYLEKLASTKNENMLEMSPYACAREQIGTLFTTILNDKSKEITLQFIDVTDEQVLGSIVGLELSLYRYGAKEVIGKIKFTRNGKKLAKSIIDKAKSIGLAVNQARHLVNIPPNELHPVSYAKGVKELFSKSTTIKVSILDEKRLQRENCNLLLSVGMSSNNKPRIVHIKYRPKNVKSKKTIALIGKGITFDSGGLDMKSAAGMRYMKKDMGGSATLVGFTRWLESSDIKVNTDIYLALAENAISENATRPSDIITARNGMTVEIHNTDAEGRLALADAMDLALDSKPDVMIDVATLTGAGKVALGQDIASLFSNDNKLADDLQVSSSEMGDLVWKMPLYSPYYNSLKSEFSDISNAASAPGGAITAALFLEKFVGKTKWAHLDIFGWTSGSKPSLKQLGGSGQGVETLIGYFKKI